MTPPKPTRAGRWVRTEACHGLPGAKVFAWWYDERSPTRAVAIGELAFDAHGHARTINGWSATLCSHVMVTTFRPPHPPTEDNDDEKTHALPRLRRGDP
jgi:hypothetical protein